MFAFLAGRKRVAWTAVISFFAFTAFGAIFQWSQTWQFWFGLSGGNTRTASPLYVGNQSLLGVVYRLIGETTALTLLGLAISGLVALLGAVVASQWWRAGEKVFAVALVGLCTCLASPLSWTHHHVWVLPMGVAVVLGRNLPTWVRLLAGAWVVWVCVCLPLAVLPYGGDPERSYTLRPAGDRQPRSADGSRPGRRARVADGERPPEARGRGGTLTPMAPQTITEDTDCAQPRRPIPRRDRHQAPLPGGDRRARGHRRPRHAPRGRHG